MLDKEFWRVYNKNAEIGEAVRTACKFSFGTIEYLSAKPSWGGDAKPRNFITNYASSCEDRGGEFEFGKKSTPGCNIVSLRILGCNLFYFRKFPVTQPERSWRAKKEQTGREPFEIRKFFMDGAEDDTTENKKEE